MSGDWEGLLLIDKPAGPTSHDIVDRLRRLTGIRRVGHAGTLDPPATGLLPVMLGRATRLIRFLPASPKTYDGSIELGRTTDTDDATGTTLRRHTGPLPGETEVEQAAAAFAGRLLQVPPRVSARRIEGRRMYDLARRGVAFEPRPTEVEVLAFRVWPAPEPGSWGFEAVVSSGTYVRALARDLGAALGCGATLAALRRTRIGPLDLADAVALPAGEATAALRRALVPLDRIPLTVADLPMDGLGAGRFVLGQAVAVPPGTAMGFFGARDPGGGLLGIGESRDGTLVPRVVLAGPAGAPLPD